MSIVRRLTLFLMLSVVPGCGDHSSHEHRNKHSQPEPPAQTNRIAVPVAVRQNLGITFARAELRAVQRTLRLPGRFELEPTATRSHPALLAGPVELYVKLFSRVTQGELLARIRAPELQDRQQRLHQAHHGIEQAEEAVKLARAELRAGRRRLGSIRRRLKLLAGAQVRRADLEAKRDYEVAGLPVFRARLNASQSEVARERHHRQVRLRGLASLTRWTVDELIEEMPIKDHKDSETSPRWNTMDALEIRARANGIVTHIGVTPGAWANQGTTVVNITDESALRYVATALQSDIGRLKDGQAVTLVGKPGQTAKGTLRMGVAVDGAARGFPILVTLDAPVGWAKPNLMAFAEVVVDGTTAPEIAVPRAAVVRDGLNDVFFRRDPIDPDKVIRVLAELGIDDGRWVTVFSGINVGDDIVVDGAYELLLASSVKPTSQGHFHPDGTFHPEK